MKFLRISQHTEDFYKNFPPNLKELLDEHLIWLQGQKDTGHYLDGYLLEGNASGDRSIQLWEFNSVEDMDDCFWDDPMGMTFSWEIAPAIDIFHHVKNVRKTL